MKNFTSNDNFYLSCLCYWGVFQSMLQMVS